MKLSLSANISKLRKEHAMTQEQLAEALGVTFASVSKWERGVATPELNLIAEMADLFEVSIDALIGYQFRNNNRETVITRLKQHSFASVLLNGRFWHCNKQHQNNSDNTVMTFQHQKKHPQYLCRENTASAL